MSFVDRIIAFFLDNKLIAALLLLALVGWGVATAPFDWDVDGLPRDPVPVDAIPDIGANQQIVFTEWPGRSPQDIDDQITYPLTTELLALPGVEAVRSSSMFGFSMINIIFEDDIEFYWSRTRILETLNALSENALPDGVQPQLGPDATALGQIFWYTLEGRNDAGEPTGGWDLHELRSIQDFQVRYALSSAKGVAEVASIGGHVQEYQVDIDPAAMRESNVSVTDIASAVQQSNRDVGARTLELNRAEYVVRGRGQIESLADIEQSVVDVRADNTPIRIQDVARVSLGPAQRRGILDKGGSEAVGGVVVARYGDLEITGLDLSEEMIARARRKVGDDLAVTLRQGSADDLPFTDEAFNVVVSTSAFHYYAQPEQALSEFQRVLRPGGCLAMLDWNADYWLWRLLDPLIRRFDAGYRGCYAHSAVRDLLDEADFQNVRVYPTRVGWIWGVWTAFGQRPC